MREGLLTNPREDFPVPPRARAHREESRERVRAIFRVRVRVMLLPRVRASECVRTRA